MLEKNFTEVYNKFKLQFYKKIFKRFQAREASLTAVETFCVEAIYALKRPTINEFATFTQISAPNAAYKINNLIKKGYVKKVQSTVDKREFYLEVTDRFLKYYGISYDYIEVVMRRIYDRFPSEDIAKLENMLEIISQELMPEAELPGRGKDRR
ncbi:MAG: MarR family winged helix-turn-helix transcriptional regulator [Angelakisella sp.]